MTTKFKAAVGHLKLTATTAVNAVNFINKVKTKQ